MVGQEADVRNMLLPEELFFISPQHLQHKKNNLFGVAGRCGSNFLL
jgi:hypothetical protein